MDSRACTCSTTSAASTWSKTGSTTPPYGHIHNAELRDINGILNANDGDWVESLTALVEHADGTLEITDWSGRTAPGALQAGKPQTAAAPTVQPVAEPV
jgi:hypothetical protein